MTQLSSSVSRNEAAKILNVSTRTLDRYIRQRKISTVRRGRNLKFDLEELRRFQQKKEAILQPKFQKFGSFDMEEGELIEKINHIDSETTDDSEAAQESVQTARIQSTETVEHAIYRKLYEEASTELKKREELLQGANYRVGQLEAKLQNMVPLLEYRKQKEQTEKLAEEVTKKEKVCKALSENIRVETFNKKIYTILFFMSLGLFPILLTIHLLTVL